jgi:nitrite reductase (NADH) small subunit
MRTASVAARLHSSPRRDADAAIGEEQKVREAANTGDPATWIRVCRADDIPRLGARVLRRPYSANVAVFRTAADTFFALEDRCPHRGGPLSQGIVFGERVACPLHNTNVELTSGCAVAPDKGQVQAYEVKLEGDFVYVALASDGSDNG